QARRLHAAVRVSGPRRPRRDRLPVRIRHRAVRAPAHGMGARGGVLRRRNARQGLDPLRGSPTLGGRAARGVRAGEGLHRRLHALALARGLLVAPGSTLDEVVASPQLAARDYWQPLEHPELGRAFLHPGPFARFAASPIRYRRRPPTVGEHNAEVYGDELGLDMDGLVRRGIICPWPPLRSPTSGSSTSCGSSRVPPPPACWPTTGPRSCAWSRRAGSTRRGRSRPSTGAGPGRSAPASSTTRTQTSAC